MTDASNQVSGGPQGAPEGAGAQEGSSPIGEGWHRLENFDPAAATFPARARLNGEWILLFQARDGLRGVERACPHLKATLQDAVLMAGGTVLRCKQHNFTFKLSDGRGVSPPSTQLRVFDIRVADGVAYGRPGAGACPLKE
jgi:nitrite reductase/ring-hydroxylating ferredoxin subunit